MDLIMRIGGQDITKYIAAKGVKYTRNDVDGPNAGRSLDGTMIRDRVAVKGKWNVTCKPLTESQKNTLYNLILNPTLTLVTNSVDGTTRTYSVYSNNVTFGFLIPKNGADRTEDMWEGFTFPLIEL